MELEEKLAKSREIILALQRAGKRPKCADCAWVYDMRTLSSGYSFHCRQPMISNPVADSDGITKHEVVSAKRARESADLCGPEADLFLERTAKEKFSLHWNRHSRTYIGTPIALALGVGAAAFLYWLIVSGWWPIIFIVLVFIGMIS